MKKLISLVAAMVLAGAGCTVTTNVAPTPTNTDAEARTTQDTSTKPDTQWKTVWVGGVASVNIPPQCNGEGAAGSIYITCPQPQNETPIPEMVISSDGAQVNIKRREGLDSPYWDAIVASLKIQTPLKQALQINIEK